MNIEPMNGNVLVDPWYEHGDNKIGSLYLPGGSTNPMSQLGRVVKVPRDQDEVQIGDIILYHPFHCRPYRVADHEYMFVPDREFCGFVTAEGNPYPRDNDLLIAPQWPAREEEYKIGDATMVRLHRWAERPEPPTYALIARRGRKMMDRYRTGDRILLPKEGGWEIGLKDRVYYFIPGDKVEVVIK
jgi:co-chaperonin GroES (HSP10)